VSASFAVKQSSPKAAKQGAGKSTLNSLRINEPNDAFEQEADRVADEVMAGAALPRWSLSQVRLGQVQRQSAPDPQASQVAPTNQPAPQPNNYKDLPPKLGEAFLQTDVGKKLQDAIRRDPLVKDLEAFLGTLSGKIVAGSAATAAVSALAATHQSLPVQIPEIPLDSIQPGLKVKLTYEGPVDHPTKAMILFTFTPQGEKKKEKQTDSEKYRAETERIAEDQEKFRAGLKYAPGTPEAKQQEAEQKAMDDYLMSKLGTLPGTGGRPLMPGSGTGTGSPQSGLPWSFSPTVPAAQEKKLDFDPGPASSAPTLQRKCACGSGSTEGECEECKNKSEDLQRKAAGSTEADVAPPIVDRVLHSSGRPLDQATRDYFEPRFGYDLSKVRLHTDAEAAESARAVNAVAYTVGESIAFAAGRYSPQSTEGRRLLAHELTHSLQQGYHSRLAQDGSTHPTTKAVPRVSGHTSHGVARQIDPTVEAKRKDFEDSVVDGQWEHAAEILNGFNVDDIRKMLAKLSEMQAASIYVGATRNGAVGPQSNAAIMTRASFLDLNYNENRQAGNWSEAAKYLNGFNKDDILSRLRKLPRDQKQSLLDGAKANSEAGPDSNVAKLTTQALEAPPSQARAQPESSQAKTAPDAGTSDAGDAGTPAPTEDFARQAASQAHRTEQLECVIRLSGCGGDRSGVFEEPEVSSVNEKCKEQTGYSGENITPTNEECLHPPKLTAEARPVCDSTPEPEINSLGATDKLSKAWDIAKPHLLPDAVKTLDDFFSPGNIAMLIGFEVGFAVVEATPVGWAADVVAAFFLGQTLFEIVGDLLEFLSASRAANLCELNAAADALRKLCMTMENVAITVAILSPKGKGAGERAYEAPASEATVDVLRKDGTILRMPKEAAEPLTKENSAKVVGGELTESGGTAKGLETEKQTNESQPKPSGTDPADQGTAPGLTRDQATAARAAINDFNAGEGILGKVWDKVANPGEKAKLTKSNSRRLFNNQRARFWRAVFDDPAAKAMFEKMGCKFPKRGRAPVLELPSGEKFEMTIDHHIERQTDPTKALDSSNLRISPRRENTVVLRQLHDQDPFQNPAKHGWEPIPPEGVPEGDLDE
jgi:hypothetical protein